MAGNILLDYGCHSYISAPFSALPGIVAYDIINH